MIDRTIARRGLAGLAAVAILGGAASALVEEAQDTNTRPDVDRSALRHTNDVSHRPTPTPRFNDPAGQAITAAGSATIDCTCDGIWSVGDRVELVTEGAVQDLPVGSLGTVVSGLSAGLPPLLVEWDDLTTGHDGFENPNQCIPVPGDGSTSRWYVGCDTIVAASGGGVVDCVCDGVWSVGDRVELVTEGAVQDLPVGSLGSVVSGANGSPPLCVAWDDLTTGHGGNGNTVCPVDETDDTNRWYVACDAVIAAGGGGGDIDCACDAQYSAGDIVVCVIGGFEGGTYGLGRRGTVLSGVPFGEDGLVLVQWDSWFEGHDGFGSAGQCPPVPADGSTSRWYVPCDNVALLVGCTADINGDGEVNGADLTIVLGAWGSCP